MRRREVNELSEKVAAMEQLFDELMKRVQELERTTTLFLFLPSSCNDKQLNIAPDVSSLHDLRCSYKGVKIHELFNVIFNKLGVLLFIKESKEKMTLEERTESVKKT